MKSCLILLLFLGLLVTEISSDRVVMTDTGPLQGVTASPGEITVEAFLGIPYAEPPLGRLRFQRTVPKTSWSGVLDASRLPPPCIQNATRRYYYAPVIDNMSEDCLYLNLWVPYSRKASMDLRPILIFIHGGAFNTGGSNMDIFDGTRLAKFGDIIVATLNYRVGAMGFFAAFISEADGNMGLYDQVTAVRWIKENAKYFGGDPNHLVLMGESAGAMAIGGHLSSPLTKNLFKRVIMQSGGSVLPLIHDNNAGLYKISQKLAMLAGCADKTTTLKDSPGIIVRCLKRLSAREIAEAEGLMMVGNPLTFYPRTGDEYYPKPTIDDLKAGVFYDGELLIGINEEEGNFFLTITSPEYFGTYGINKVNSVSKRLAFHIMRFMYQQFLPQPNDREIAEYYLSKVVNASSDAYTKTLAASVGDFLITCSTYFVAEYYALRNPVYFYLFSRRPSSTMTADWMGTTHFDELQYVFGNPLFDNFTQAEEELSVKMMQRWVSFIKTGNPNTPNSIKWPLFSHEHPEYLRIDEEESVHLRPDDYRCDFWRKRFQATLLDDEINAIRRSSATLVQPFLIVIYAAIPMILTMRTA